MSQSQPHMTAADRQRHLDRLNATYCTFNQEPRESELLLADGGHPLGEDFRVLLAAWRSLKYACNSSSRIVHFRDDGEQSEMSMPDLNVVIGHHAVARLPDALRERHYRDFADAPSLYPGEDHEGYLAYLRRCVALKFPESCEPTLSLDLTVRTRNVRLASDVMVATEGRFIPSRDQTDGALVVRAFLSSKNGNVLRQAKAVLAAIHRRMGRWMPAARTAADEAADRMPLELPQKAFTLGGVRRVTVNDHHVMVPLIPLGGDGSVLRDTINDLLALVRDGYPWAPVRRWMCSSDGKARFVTAETLQALDREFGGAPATK